MNEIVTQYGVENTLRLNTGNAFKKKGDIDRKRAELIMEAYDHMGYELFAFGPQDAVFGLPALAQMASDKSYTLLCSNLEPTKEQSDLNIQPYAVLNKSGQKVLVTSIIDPTTQASDSNSQNVLKLERPNSQLAEIFSAVPHDLSVVVVHSYKFNIEALMTRLAVKPDLVVLAYQAGVFVPSRLKSGSVMVGNNYQGKSVCRYQLVKNATFSPQNWTVYQLVVDTVIPEPHIKEMLSQQEQWEKEYWQQQNIKKQFSARKQDNFYLGDGWCVRCHQQIHEQWSKSRHAQAIKTLAKKERLNDPRCLPCHVTGMAIEGEKAVRGGGFSSMEQTPHLTNVQCESCHGPGKKHSQQPDSNKMVLGTAAICVVCHTEESSPNFIYDAANAH